MQLKIAGTLAIIGILYICSPASNPEPPPVLVTTTQDTAAKKEEHSKLEKVFGICLEARFPTLVSVDDFTGFSQEEKDQCKARLRLLNPVIE